MRLAVLRGNGHVRFGDAGCGSENVLAIACRLHFEHFRVLSAQRQQLLVGSFFDQTSTREYYDAVSHADR